jgi:hypothetical protein
MTLSRAFLFVVVVAGLAGTDCGLIGPSQDRPAYVGTWSGSMTYPSAGTGMITLTIDDESRHGLWNLGVWSVTFPDARYNDQGRLQMVANAQKLDSLGFFLWTSRFCQGRFGRIEINHIVVVSVAGDHMTGTYTEGGCTVPFLEGTLDLKRR